MKLNIPNMHELIKKQNTGGKDAVSKENVKNKQQK